MKPLSIPLTILILCSTIHLSLAEEAVNQEAFLRGLRSGSKAFTKLPVNEDSPTAFNIVLNESVVTLENGDVFDGFSFTAPPSADTKDFLWYFNCPNNWSHWYVIPMEGDMQQAFKGWLNADKIYQGFDMADEENRFRALQMLKSGYFIPGQRYLMWFRRHRVEQENPQELQVRGSLAFVPPSEEWDHDSIEQTLKLIPQNTHKQIQHLDSTGGTILLDKDFFRKPYAENRIRDMFSTKRFTQQHGDFFITMETHIPICRTTPAIEAIIAKYGKPDFIESPQEQALRAGKDNLDEFETIYHYDHFGFETIRDKNGQLVVQRVSTNASDFSMLSPENEKSTFRGLKMRNLIIFYADQKESGRMYYFLEGAKTPIVINEPAIGVYQADNSKLEYFGNGKWQWSIVREDGSIEQEIALENHQFNGVSRSTHANGQTAYTSIYKNGVMHGEAFQYDENGNEIRRAIFKDGERVE